MAVQIRIDKYLADMGIGSRSEIKQWLRNGRVTINEEFCKKPDIKVIPEVDRVTFDHKIIQYHKYIYFMLNKPSGVVSATIDNVHTTVLDIIIDKEGKELFPVGRLDKDTEGLLLITNDGELAHQLLSPKKHVDKVYYAKVKGIVTEEDQQAFSNGISIEEYYVTLPAILNILKADELSEIELTIREGKFHQVKRMFEAVGKEVIYLKRLSMGGLKLDPSLKIGDYRKLTQEEVDYLKSLQDDENYRR